MVSKRIFSFVVLSIFSLHIQAQDIVNLFLVGDSGITENAAEAHSFIALKQYPGNVFERLDYKMNGPLVLLRTYSDSLLENLDGRYIEYNRSGMMRLQGDYANNLKEGKWRYYNDTGKVILTETYKNGELTFSELPDTVKKDTTKYPGDKEAFFKSEKNNRDWSNYIMQTLSTDISAKVGVSANIVVAFEIDTTGKTNAIYMQKSALFSYDEEGLRVIRQSPLWHPANQNGRKVKAYRVQPLTFIVDEK